MPKLYVENVPNDLYAALRKRARDNGTSISAQVLGLLRSKLPTTKDLARRQVLKRAMRQTSASSTHSGPTTEQMQREGRER